MASGEKILTTNSFARMDVSTATPQTPGGLSNLGAIGAGSFEGGTPSLAQQEIQQAQQNLASGVVVQPSISTSPNISPFPLGCPSGFYQSGDVCIPSVDTAGMNLPSAPAAGHELPKGSIQQTISDQTTNDGSPFYITTYFTNNGILGKFFQHITIPDIGVDVKSTGVWIPEGQNGVLYKQILMPGTTPTCSNGFSATIQLQHEDPGTGNLMVDDTDTVQVPCPGAGPTTPTPPFQQNCFTASDGSKWCSSPTDTGGCQPDPNHAGLFWCKQCSCGSGQKWNSCVCGCVPSASLIPDCPPSNCPQCGQAPPTPTPGPQSCITFQGQQYCVTNAPPGTPGCFTANGVTYCAVGNPPTPNCPTGYTYDSVNKVCVQTPSTTCPTGYTYDPTSKNCVQTPSTQCPPGYTYNSTTKTCVQNPAPTPTCPNGFTYDSTRNVCVQNAQEMPTCFSIRLPDLFVYASTYSRFVEIRTPNILIIDAQGKGLNPTIDSVQFCQNDVDADDSVHINGRIYRPHWPASSHLARMIHTGGSRASARARTATIGGVRKNLTYARAAGTTITIPNTAGDPEAGNNNNSMPSCFTITLPQLFEHANSNARMIKIRNSAGLVANLQQKGLPMENTSITFCKTSQLSSDDSCVEVGSAVYCPQITHNENNLSKPVMIITPSDHVMGGEMVTVNLSSFAPNEPVTISVLLKTTPVGQQDTNNVGWNNREIENTYRENTDTTGSLNVQIPIPALATSVKGHVLISALGSRSMKQVAKGILVV